MTETRARVPAVGGTRTVPEPDAIARDYLLLGLRLDQHAPGLVDGYFGPADLKGRVDLEPRRPPARLLDDATALRGRLAAEVEAVDRRTWLEAQLVALETQAASLAGAPIPYVERVTRSFGITPIRRSDAEFEAAAARIEELLPGDGPLLDRLVAWDAALEIPVERLRPVVDWLIERLRGTATETLGVPTGEQLTVSLVRQQPWSGYNWYDGGLRSRIDINTDLPTRATDLPQLLAHEAFPGHHLEHAWKEADLVEGAGRLESSILLINTPECLISEGLADLGYDVVMADSSERAELLEEVFSRAGLPVAADPLRAREIATLAVALAEPRAALRATRVNAALMLHAEGLPRSAVLDYLIGIGRYSAEVAEKRIEFIEHPLWRTYVFVYSEGEALLRRWVDAVPDAGRPGRFARLLHEQLTPGAIVAELDTS